MLLSNATLPAYLLTNQQLLFSANKTLFASNQVREAVTCDTKAPNAKILIGTCGTGKYVLIKNCYT